MKGTSIKKQKEVKNNLKISHFFKKLPSNDKKSSSLNTNNQEPDSDESIDLLQPITNLPKRLKSSQINVTPEAKKRKRSPENSPSPDIIPSSIGKNEQRKFNGFIKLPYLNPTKNVTSFPVSPSKSSTSKGNFYLTCKPTNELIDASIPSTSYFQVKPQTPTTPQKKSYITCDLTQELIHSSVPSTSNFQVTPEKRTKNKVSTPKKITPTKLFGKSPKKLHEFQVHIMENFVKITPSKSSEKIKHSILSPTSSNRSMEIQQRNESTPIKTPKSHDRIIKGSKVKTKLDFSFADDLEKDTTHKDSVVCSLDDSWDDDVTESIVHELDLSRSQHCKILKVEKTIHELRLLLESTKSKSTALCVVEGFWTHMKLSPNDTIHITGVYDRIISKWRVTNEHGLVVYEPNFLISSTAVVGALFCKRRSVLSERFRGFEPSNRVMIVGILVHKLLQEVLKRNVCDFNGIEIIVNEIINERDTMWSCYESQLELDDLRKELKTFIPKIVSFMGQYVGVNASGTKKREDWSGKIDKIQDIEENIWCPELGIKGKIDVSIESGLTTMPLELKTSRATISLEHRGQVMLYVMMMQKFGYNVSSGLLLYLREGVLREIPITNKEKRDLILLRNELTYYLTRKPLSNGESIDQLTPSELPDPINHHSACSKCPYNTICCAFLKYNDVNLQGNLLREVQSDILSHLKKSHLEYFIKWSSLLALEASHTVGNKQMQDIYTLPPAERKKRGQTIIGVKVVDVDVECGGVFKHTFQKFGCDNDESAINLQASGITIGNYIVVSINSRAAVSSGFVIDIKYETITISLDRDLNKRYQNETFHLDTYNSSTSQTFNLTNLALLLEESEQSDKLRRIIIDKELPTFKNKLPKSVATKGTPILRTLNQLQQKAVLKTLTTNDYLLIKGMPGTGKTATIVALIQILVELNKTVLITSHTHAAVDNVCVKLQDHGINVLRLGKGSKINPILHSCSEEFQTQHCRTPEELEKVYNAAKVLAVTCLGSGHPVLSKRQLDVCIVDESTQVIQTSLIRTLYCARKFVLIGDPNQLPPVIRNYEAISLGLGESLFERLDKPEARVNLNLNYRMNQPITDMANALTYDGELEVANKKIANATLQINKKKLQEDYSSQPWIINVLDDSLESSIKIINTGQVNNLVEENHGCANKYESAIVFALVNALLNNGVLSSSIGIIAPYRAQVSQLSNILTNLKVDVSTVDQFQGQDRDVIIYTCTKSNSNYHDNFKFEILEDKRRLTVAITRAKHKFILIGDLETVKKYSPFAKLLESLPKQYFLKVEDEVHGFSWNKLIQQLP